MRRGGGLCPWCTLCKSAVCRSIWELQGLCTGCAHQPLQRLVHFMLAIQLYLLGPGCPCACRGRKLAQEHGYTLDSNKELRGGF